MRTTFLQFRLSRIPESVGTCAADIVRCAAICNEATQRLLIAGGETGFYGTWQKMVFSVNPSDPYITLPRQVARLINMDVCKFPVRIQNSFYEFLEAGIGLQPQGPCACPSPCSALESYDRGNVPTFRDIDPKGNSKLVRVYLTNERDHNHRVLVQGLDQNGIVVRTLDNGIDTEGEYLNLDDPFTDSQFFYSKITGIQKDLTAGDVRIYQVDSVTGEQVSLSVMEPGETVGWYRRYFINGIKNTCCQCDTVPGNACANPTSAPKTAQIVAMAKLEFVPVSVDTDWLLIGNIPALKAECFAVRYEESDNEKSLAMAEVKHRQAIKLLNQELTHYTGRLNPAVNVALWGTAKLEHQRIGTLI